MASEANNALPAPEHGAAPSPNRQRRRRRGGKRRWPPRVARPADAESDAVAHEPFRRDQAEHATAEPAPEGPLADDWLDARLAAALQRLEGDQTAEAPDPAARTHAADAEAVGDAPIDPELIRLLRGLDATIDTARHVLFAAAQAQAQYCAAIERKGSDGSEHTLTLPELPEMLPPPPAPQGRALAEGRAALFATVGATVAVLVGLAWHLHTNPSAGLDIGQALAGMTAPPAELGASAPVEVAEAQVPPDAADAMDAAEAAAPVQAAMLMEADEPITVAEARMPMEVAEPTVPSEAVEPAHSLAAMEPVVPAQVPRIARAEAQPEPVPQPVEGDWRPNLTRAEPETSVPPTGPRIAATAPAAETLAGAIEYIRGAADSGALPAPVRGPAGEPMALALPLPEPGEETELSVMIQGTPESVRLSAGRRAGADTWILTAEQAENLTLLAPADFGPGEFALDVTLVTSDGRIPQAYSIAVAVDPAEVRIAKVEPAALDARVAAAPPDAIPLVPETPGTAPPLPVVPATGTATGESPVAVPEPLDPEAERRLLGRGAELLAQGDASAARLIYEYAARRGSAPAMLALGRSYDPEYLAKAGVRGVEPDKSQATAWYERAARASDR